MSPVDEKRIEIVGAGPSGLAAAIALRKAGYGVTVYEERKDIGMRFHGDFQGIENWSRDEDALLQLRGFGIEINFLAAPYFGGVVYGPERQRVEVASKRPLFYLVRRGPAPDSLDSGLKAQALAAGVEIVFGRRVEKIAGPAITATGPKGADAIARGVTFETDLPDQVVAILDDRLAPGGYAYLLVHQHRATMATVLFRDFKREKECFEAMQKAFGELISIKKRTPAEFGGFGNFFERGRQEHGHHLYVGESAGFQDALWGFGIRSAILSGRLAAESLLKGESYDSLWQKKLRPAYHASLINRMVVDRLGAPAYRFVLNRLAGKTDVRDILHRLYEWRAWKGLLLPFAERHYRSRVKDERCNHPEDCRCVWCRCERA